jgi:hypothetical protein
MYTRTAPEHVIEPFFSKTDNQHSVNAMHRKSNALSMMAICIIIIENAK